MKKVIKVTVLYWAWLSIFSMLQFLLQCVIIAHTRDDFEDTYDEDVVNLLGITDKYPLVKRVENIENAFVRIMITILMIPYWIWICHFATVDYYENQKK